MFLPTTRSEAQKLGWKKLDVILITGDAYIDSPYIGIAVIGNVLANAGYRVGVISQPDIHADDIRRLGEPGLFWGVSGGCIDSLVANYTATRKWRKSDDFTPGGLNDRRPDRALIVYSNLIRRHFKNTRPIVLGGIEASLRRISHYDYWSNKVRRSVLFDAKADFLVYGMGEKTVIQLAGRLRSGQDATDIPGICYISKSAPPSFMKMPDHQTVSRDRSAFIDMFQNFYAHNDPLTASGLFQLQDSRYLVQNPPQPYCSQRELDQLHDLEYERDVHPSHRQSGTVRALETIRFSIPTHRGCYGECNFCAIAVHQGRTVRWRSEESILREARVLSRYPDFTGSISDVGGPTANMYGFECRKKLAEGCCSDKRCLFPRICPSLAANHGRQLRLLRRLRKIDRIRNIFISSGLRYDLLNADQKYGKQYISEIARHHVSGQLKIAPEHMSEKVLQLMGKPGIDTLLSFRKAFQEASAASGKNQFLTYYLIAAHPGCTESDMKDLKHFAVANLRVIPRQVQIFTPTPSTYSSLMYHTGIDPFSGEKIFVEKNDRKKEKQKRIILSGAL